MKATAKYLAVLATALLFGCGGDGHGPNLNPCGGMASGGSFNVSYGERSRAISSALSGKLVVTHGNATGGDLTFNFARNSTLAAHTETYSLPAVSTSATTGTLSLYGSTGQTGPVVATATATIAATCSSFSISSFSLVTTVAHVAVTPVTLTVGGAAQQLAFSATDSRSAVVAVTPGSAVFAGVGSAATVTKDGMITPASVGSITVTATVDGVTSSAATIQVQSGETVGTGYRIVDLGPSALLPAYSFLRPSECGRMINNSSKCVIYDLTANHYYVVDATNPSSKTLLGGSDGQTLIYGIDAAGDVIGRENGVGAIYWKAPNYTTYTPFNGTNAQTPDAANASGAVIGSGFGNPFYWSSVSATAQSMALLSDTSIPITVKDINAPGLIVGYGTVGTTRTTNEALYYSDHSSTPSLLASPGTGADYTATACDDSGVIVGYQSTQYGVSGLMWNSKTSAVTQIGVIMPFGISNKGLVVGASIDFGTAEGTAGVYTTAGGFKTLYSLCDSSRTGWALGYAVAINDGGSIFGQGKLNGAEHTFVAVPK